MQLIDWLGNMRGPDFLFLYAAVFVALWLLTSLRLRRVDQSLKLGRHKLPTQPDPYELAFLRGGNPEVAQLALYRLAQRGLITLNGHHPASPELLAATQTLEHNPLERGLERWVKRIQADGAPLSWSQAPELTSTLLEQVTQFTRLLQERLEQEQLIQGLRGIRMARSIAGQACVFFGLLGGFKLSWALAHGRYNVLFLILLGLFGMAMLWRRRKRSRLTERGSQYLQDIQDIFSAQKRSISSEIRTQRQAAELLERNSNMPQTPGWNPAHGVAPLVLMGAYGMSMLPPEELGHFQRLRQQAQAQVPHNSSGGGCGSCSGFEVDGSGFDGADSSSSCSSSDSSSSCSSSDGGGGGCGGCGGGGD